MIDLTQVTACLITKDRVYPKDVLKSVADYPFGELLVLTSSDSPGRKHELFAKAKFDWIYYQDDDALCPIEQLSEQVEPGVITIAMKQGHFDAYAHTRMTMGLGWGAFFEKPLLASLKRYTDVYGEDEVYKRETERIFTYLNYPQKRLVLPITDTPAAYAEDRLWRQPKHQDFAKIAEQRCQELISA